MSARPSPPVRAAETARPRRIGLFGGSFDPVHAGHLHVARAAQRHFGLDRVVFVPAAQSPFKPARTVASGADRLALLCLALAGEPTWCASAIELERGGTSFTIDTVRALPAALGESEDVELYLLIGGDNLGALPRWREARALLERVQPVVVHRAGDPPLDVGALRAELGDELARKIERGRLDLAPVDVNATDLRARLARGERDVAELAPEVRDYIRAHRLYGARA